MKLFMIVTIGFCLYNVSYCSHVDHYCSSVWDGNLDQLNNSVVRFTLLHREHPCLMASTSRVNGDTSSMILSRYHARVRGLASRLSSYPAYEANVSGQIRIGSGVHWDYYTYITQIRVGTPASTHPVLVDTGSSLSWIGCQPCTNGCQDPIFNPAASSTYNFFRCRSSICNAVPAATMSPATCVMPYQSCSFKQTYEDRSTSVGVVSSDRLLYGSAEMQGFVFGCTNSFKGVGGQYSGIIGLSSNKLSFFSQISIGRYKAMSYCFPFPSKVGFLQFGHYNEQQQGLSYTPLFINNNEYYVHITNITVGSTRLDIQLGQNGTLRCSIDTGTPYTMVPPSLFASLSDAVENNMQGYYRVGSTTGQTCFQPDMWWDSENEETPTVEIVFKDGPRLTLLENLFFLEGEYLCLAFKESRSQGNELVLGSRHIMTLYTIVDLEKSRMGLLQHGCTS